MIIRKATKDDIPFIADAIIEIENTSESNTYNNLFGCDTSTTKEYLEQFLLDEENLDTELSLNTYCIVEIEGERAGCCSLFFTDSNYHQNKSELFPIHLKKEHLENFIKNVKTLPDTKEISKNKYFLEYLFVDKKFRGYGVSKILIEHLASQTDRLYLIPLETNTFAIDYYFRLGFVENETVKKFLIDRDENPIYPHDYKIMLYRNQEKKI